MDDFIQLWRLCQTGFVQRTGAGGAGAIAGGESHAQSIAELIADRIDTMPAGERRAAQTLVANYPLIGLKTVAEFSQAAGVSSPTILRFVARLGFQNYAEFQAALQDELAAQLQSPASRAGRRSRRASGGRRRRSRRRSRTSARRSAMSRTGRSPTSSALLANRNADVFLVGGRFTDPIARYMAAHLTIIRPNVFHLAGQESNWRDRLIDMGKRDVLRDLRHPPLSGQPARASPKRRIGAGVHIVLFTDQWLSPIARFARHVVAGRTAVPSAWDSSAALFVVAETLIGEVTRRLEGERAADPRDGRPALNKLRDQGLGRPSTLQPYGYLMINGARCRQIDIRRA